MTRLRLKLLRWAMRWLAGCNTLVLIDKANTPFADDPDAMLVAIIAAPSAKALVLGVDAAHAIPEFEEVRESLLVAAAKQQTMAKQPSRVM